MGYVKSKRSVIYPNPGFQRQLLDFEKKLIASRRSTAHIAETMPKQQQASMGVSSPMSFLKENLRQTLANKSAQVKSQDGLNYKPKYKNLRDAYEEFKILKAGGSKRDEPELNFYSNRQ